MEKDRKVDDAELAEVVGGTGFTRLDTGDIPPDADTQDGGCYCGSGTGVGNLPIETEGGGDGSSDLG